MPRLKDVLPGPGLGPTRLLLVGINPGLRSGTEGHHFAGNGNPFWRLLHASGLTPRLLAFSEDETLGTFGIALTNLCPRPTRSAAELSASELARGRRALARKVDRLRPGVVAFVGLTIYRIFFRLDRSDGAGPKPDRIAVARVFVVPNPSGLNASFPGFAHKVIWFQALRDFVEAHEAMARTVRRED